MGGLTFAGSQALGGGCQPGHLTQSAAPPPASCLPRPGLGPHCPPSPLSAGQLGGGGPRREAGGRGQTTQAVPFYGHTVAGGARTVLTRGAVPEAGTAVCRLPQGRTPGAPRPRPWRPVPWRPSRGHVASRGHHPDPDRSFQTLLSLVPCPSARAPKVPKPGPPVGQSKEKATVPRARAHTCPRSQHTHTRSHALTHT